MIINAKDAVVGRLASYVAKQALKGEEVQIVNCNQIIITGNRKSIQEEYAQKRRRVGIGQTGPKYPKTSERIVKRIIRGMLPNARQGRGKQALQRIKCYVGVPKEFEGKETLTFAKEKKSRSVSIKEISR